MQNVLPVSFRECSGLLSFPTQAAACKRTSILLCRTWGFDELCTRKFYRRLAEELSAAGFANLRFDYPGTVDSLYPGSGVGLDAWIEASLQGANLLKEQSGTDRVVLLGLGLGAAVARLAADRLPSIAGLVMAAPVVSGRRYLRETALRAKVITEGLGLDPSTLPNGRTTIGGLPMAESLEGDLKSVNLQKLREDRSFPILMIERPQVTSDADYTAHLKAAGHTTHSLAFNGYEKLMEDPTASRVPEDTISGIVGWLKDTFPQPANRAVKSAPPPGSVLADDTFQEEGLILHGAGDLYGVLCKPNGPLRPTAFVFLNAGYDHHGGWARAWVNGARELAAHGYQSFRVDFANIGDSPPADGHPDQVLYTEGPIADVSKILDALQDRFDGSIVLVGRCSGAYTAFQAGFRDERVKGLALINQVRFIWDPEESITDPARMGPRSMGDYKKRLLSSHTLTRLISGDIDIPGVLRGLSVHARTRLSHWLAPLFPHISKHARFRSECHRMFASLRARNVKMRLLCSEGDESLEQLALYFGGKLQGLKNHPQVSITTIAEADHNLTPEHAQKALMTYLVATADEVDGH